MVSPFPIYIFADDLSQFSGLNHSVRTRSINKQSLRYTQNENAEMSMSPLKTEMNFTSSAWSCPTANMLRLAIPMLCEMSKFESQILCVFSSHKIHSHTISIIFACLIITRRRASAKCEIQNQKKSLFIGCSRRRNSLHRCASLTKLLSNWCTWWVFACYSIGTTEPWTFADTVYGLLRSGWRDHLMNCRPSRFEWIRWLHGIGTAWRPRTHRNRLMWIDGRNGRPPESMNHLWCTCQHRETFIRISVTLNTRKRTMKRKWGQRQVRQMREKSSSKLKLHRKYPANQR